MKEKEEMLQYLGIKGVDDLFSDIPEDVKADIDIPDGLSEKEMESKVKDKLSKNTPLDEMANFIGGGFYHHFIPSAVREITGRSEFYTSYTPYQAEISQGMLRALFEYQSMISELTGMPVTNTSMYDYSTALAEAVLMASRISRGKGDRFIIPDNIHWERHPVLKNYLRGSDIEIVNIPYKTSTGEIDEEALKSEMDEDTLGFYVESPNAFGVIEENINLFSDLKEEYDPIFVAGIEPLLLTLMSPPSDWGADIVIGDSQSLGLPVSFGGPSVGIFGTREKYLRKMPGRLIGETEDKEGERAYCMTLQTREQHIRRERATSNICTNQSLMALASAAYIFVKGGKGLEERAKSSWKRSHELADKIDQIDGFEAPHVDGEFFNEFTVKSPAETDDLLENADDKKVLPGIPLDKEDPVERFPELSNVLLTATTEMNSEKDIDSLVEVLTEVRA